MIYQFFLMLVLTLPVCTVILAVALYHWRKHQWLKDVLNFRRPFWMAFFVSLGIITLGFIGKLDSSIILHF